MTGFLSIILAFTLLLPTVSDIAPDVGAGAAILMTENGQVVFSVNENEKRPIASTTKIMTAVIALGKKNKPVHFDGTMSAEGSSMYLKDGDTLMLYDLVCGMMLTSGNDAANAVAVCVGGTREKFAELMNKKAKELNMNNTHFVTPSGLDDSGHYSTAYDMALLCRYAMSIEEFSNIVSKKTASIKYISPFGKTQTVTNHNRLLSLYPGCDGIKTGYTEKAGRTLCSSAVKDGVRLFAVTLSDRNDWNDHAKLYDYGFLRVKNYELTSDLSRCRVRSYDGRVYSVCAESSCFAPLSEEDKPRARLCLVSFVLYDVKPGTPVGFLEYRIGSVPIACTRLCIERECSS